MRTKREPYFPPFCVSRVVRAYCLVGWTRAAGGWKRVVHVKKEKEHAQERERVAQWGGLGARIPTINKMPRLCTLCIMKSSGERAREGWRAAAACTHMGMHRPWGWCERVWRQLPWSRPSIRRRQSVDHRCVLCVARVGSCSSNRSGINERDEFFVHLWKKRVFFFQMHSVHRWTDDSTIIKSIIHSKIGKEKFSLRENHMPRFWRGSIRSSCCSLFAFLHEQDCAFPCAAFTSSVRWV